MVHDTMRASSLDQIAANPVVAIRLQPGI